MTGQLQTTGDDAPARCAMCGALAAGPCARCHNPTCGDCCVLTEGGTKVFAICLRCERRGGRSLRGPWMLVLSWIALPILLLAIAVVLIAYLS